MKSYFLIPFLFFSVSALAQIKYDVTIHDGSSYWDRKREESRRELELIAKQNQIQMETINAIKEETKNCSNNVVESYSMLTTYKTLKSGWAYKAFITNYSTFCQQVFTVIENNKIKELGCDNCTVTFSTEIINQRAKMQVKYTSGKAEFFDVYFLSADSGYAPEK